ncbi:MAG: type II secretion system F family protein, partial [Firmicutes bacterium]|nr:type II secretion system F family protein [Bacillota bacterium]
MVVYRFRAKTPQGQTVDGTVEAPSQREAAIILRGRGLLLVSAVPEARETAALPLLPRRPEPPAGGDRVKEVHVARPRGRRRLQAGGVNLKELALFCRQFGVLVTAGVAILTSLQILARQAGSRRMRGALAEVAQAIEQGQSLSDAFHSRRDVFPPIMVNMVSAGEASGALEECFERLAEHFEKEHTVAQKVRSAMTYPAMISVVAVGVVVFMIAFVLPSFVGIFAQIGAELPGPTRALMQMSDYIRAKWYVLVGVVVALAGAFRTAAATPRGAYALDALALKLPVVGDVIRKRSVSRFCRTLATLLRSGVPLLVSMSVVERTVGNRPIAEAVKAAEEQIRQGHGISAPLRASGLFPPMVLEMIGVGEETGAVDTMLVRVADYYDKEIDIAVERLSSMIEPLIIVFVGGLVGFI